MLGSVHVTAAILAAVGLGCASSVDVSIEQRRDLAGYRTWNFHTLRSGNVRASVSSTRGLDAALTRFVERCLQNRGFERATEQPDLHVVYFLEVRREKVILAETPAVDLLYSMNDSPSYEIQTTEHRVEIYETGQLKILVTDSEDDAVIWQGGFSARFRGELSPHLQGAVATLLERLPSSSASDETSPEGAVAKDALAPGECESGT